MLAVDMQIAGEIAGGLSPERLGDELRGDGWRADVGPLVVRLMNDRTTFVFAPMPDGGFILEDVMPDHDLLAATKPMSEHLAARGLRHRFEIYDGAQMTAYVHHDWPQPGGGAR
jgi:hypothetical protein